MPLVDHGILVRRYPVHPLLGRHLRLDARSLGWLHHPEPAGVDLAPVIHTPPIPVLNQQDLHQQGIKVSQLVPGADDADGLGSCTGNTGTTALATLLGADGLADAGLSSVDAVADEEFAIKLYAAATLVDDVPGAMPQEDTGSSGLAIAKTLKRQGLIGGYRHATSADAFAGLLQAGPVMLGTPWFNAWFEPPSSGLVDDVPGWEDSGVVGGHEVCVIGLDAVEQDDDGRVVPEKTIVRIRNSWGASWGDSGDFLMRLSTYNALRSAIDLIQLTA